MRPSTRSSKRAATSAAAATSSQPEALGEPTRKRQKAAEAAEAPARSPSLFSDERRAQWTAFLRAQSFARVGADFFDVFELAHAISPENPLAAFADTLGLELCGPFELLARAIRGATHVRVDKPLFLHGRFFVDPPEVTTVLKDAGREESESAGARADAGAHWGYFRDSPDQEPEYVVVAADSSKCSFTIAGSSLFHVLEARVKERRRSAESEQLGALAAKVTAYLQLKALSSVTPAALSRRRNRQATAASLHGLGIVVPCDAKKCTGYRELPVVGEKLAALLQRVVAGDASARKALSGLLTRATIANDECDFGTSLLLGLDLFTVGSALEKEALQLLKVAYMLLRRIEFSKIAVAQAAQRRLREDAEQPSSCSSVWHRHMLRSFTSEETQSHVADLGPKLTSVSFP